MVGTQQDFSNALVSLLELEYDTIESYFKAVDKLDTEEYKHKLREFANDHDRHSKELAMLLTLHKVDFTAEADIKQWLTKGKVMLADLIGDKSILFAIFTNEIDANNAYDNLLNRSDIWMDAHGMLVHAKEDIIKHKDWLEQHFR
jgi:uncharacterized radical SAM superfamily protein